MTLLRFCKLCRAKSRFLTSSGSGRWSTPVDRARDPLSGRAAVYGQSREAARRERPEADHLPLERHSPPQSLAFHHQAEVGGGPLRLIAREIHSPGGPTFTGSPAKQRAASDRRGPPPAGAPPSRATETDPLPPERHSLTNCKSNNIRTSSPTSTPVPSSGTFQVRPKSFRLIFVSADSPIFRFL